AVPGRRGPTQSPCPRGQRPPPPPWQAGDGPRPPAPSLAAPPASCPPRAPPAPAQPVQVVQARSGVGEPGAQACEAAGVVDSGDRVLNDSSGHCTYLDIPFSIPATLAGGRPGGP